jgi:hypothetical protein
MGLKHGKVSIGMDLGGVVYSMVCLGIWRC